MKTFTTILIVILTTILGNWIITLKRVQYEFAMPIFMFFFVGFFAYGVYKTLEDLEK